MKTNFEIMTKAELGAYVLSHKDDDEALRILMSRCSGIKYKFENTEEGKQQIKNLIQLKIEGKL
ncbi:MAG: hypothetical protein IGQ45_10895 [Cyanobacterium sp. T60_A2020_053]|nr:hypothetical protein [Cyanobacterium sp. T60_A2020_053]